MVGVGKPKCRPPLYEGEDIVYSYGNISGGKQTPFTTVGLGLGTGRWEREIQKAVFNVRLAGLGDGRTAIFPKILFTIKEGINRKSEDPNYDIKRLALKCAACRV